MTLNHLNLAVDDVQAARRFLVEFFGLEPEGGEGNDRMAFLRDDNGMVLTLTNIDKATEVHYPGAFHVGFIQPSPERVDAIHRRLTEAGHDAPAPSRMHGSWTFYFQAPGGFVVEVLA